ncbi:Gfo/Idh/MocA family oxidoreductase [Klebsiella pneumoniae]|uniref:Gfo/Idh/MocA family protein n=1 Tax=Klebsiella pneumoniae TaxID=573 RepID=UPI002DBD5674|nr:Gfo/Idh/MocA family oxidoreductase [Klebsiella pneumoniae]MEB6125942.1 Gfo/Idh/MocA family oxidoreductase [Klebsiella pneumoniae]
MLNGLKPLSRSLRWGMVGGGGTSQIGYSHRCAALRDNVYTLLAGALDVDAERGRAFGEQLGIAPERCYADYQTLFREEARELVDLSKKQNKIVGVTYGYAGYQMIQQARQMIADGLLGEIRIVNMQFAHGFHNQAVELQAESTRWRVTPKFAGPSYVLGDLATHPLFVAETMAPQLNIKRLMCSRQSFVPSRAPLEDNAFVLMEYDNGAVGSMWTSAVNSGAMHSQKVRIVGEKASIEWWDEHPNQLSYEVQGEPARILERGMPYLSPNALADDRIGGGHPEGLFEAWANLYRRYAQAIDATVRDDRAFLQDFWYPDVEAGLHGVYWVEQCVKSADAGSQWVDFTLP